MFIVQASPNNVNDSYEFLRLFLNKKILSFQLNGMINIGNVEHNESFIEMIQRKIANVLLNANNMKLEFKNKNNLLFFDDYSFDVKFDESEEYITAELPIRFYRNLHLTFCLDQINVKTLFISSDLLGTTKLVIRESIMKLIFDIVTLIIKSPESMVNFLQNLLIAGSINENIEINDSGDIVSDYDTELYKLPDIPLRNVISVKFKFPDMCGRFSVFNADKNMFYIIELTKSHNSMIKLCFKNIKFL